MESVQSVSAKAESVLDKADKLLSDNRAAIDDTIKNVDTFSKALSENSAGISTTLADLDSLVKSVDREKVATFIDGAAALGEAVRQNKGNIDRMLKNASELSVKLNESADKLNSLMTSLQSFVGSPELKGPLGGVRRRRALGTAIGRRSGRPHQGNRRRPHPLQLVGPARIRSAGDRRTAHDQ